MKADIGLPGIDELSAALQQLDAELRGRDRIIAKRQSALKVDHPPRYSQAIFLSMTLLRRKLCRFH
jgi:hypothetical protein